MGILLYCLLFDDSIYSIIRPLESEISNHTENA